MARIGEANSGVITRKAICSLLRAAQTGVENVKKGNILSTRSHLRTERKAICSLLRAGVGNVESNL